MQLQERRIQKQTCPLCNQPQDIIVNGHRTVGDGLVEIDNARGYSFCNCRNIFFTSWANIEQSYYDDKYTKRYDSPRITNYMRKYVQTYLPVINWHVESGRVLEIGCINPGLLDAFKEAGYQTYGLDIIPHEFEGHTMFASDYESFQHKEGFDLIWASHIFEHFKDPLAALVKSFSLLNEGGLLFVAMPDPFFIDWKNPYSWGHWHLREHHIIWDMDSFCDAARHIGFEVILAKHNVTYDFICSGDQHIILKKASNV